jgi:hypothetical protein
MNPSISTPPPPHPHTTTTTIFFKAWLRVLEILIRKQCLRPKTDYTTKLSRDFEENEQSESIFYGLHWHSMFYLFCFPLRHMASTKQH